MFGLTAWINGGIGAVAGAALAAAVMWGHETYAVSAAVSAAERQGVVTCNARVQEIEAQHGKAVSEAVEAARTAAFSLPPPQTPDAIKAACQASASCRSRGAP
jgi:2-methylcitrate dehydratase PrpD